MLMVKTKRLDDVPLAAYEFSTEMKQKMQDKVKKRMLFEQDKKVSKRVQARLLVAVTISFSRSMR